MEHKYIINQLGGACSNCGKSGHNIRTCPEPLKHVSVKRKIVKKPKSETEPKPEPKPEQGKKRIVKKPKPVRPPPTTVIHHPLPKPASQRLSPPRAKTPTPPRARLLSESEVNNIAYGLSVEATRLLGNLRLDTRELLRNVKK